MHSLTFPSLASTFIQYRRNIRLIPPECFVVEVVKIIQLFLDGSLCPSVSETYRAYTVRPQLLVSSGTEHEKVITGYIIAPTVLRSQAPVLQMPHLLPSIAGVLHRTPRRAKRGCLMLAEREPSGIGKLLRELRDG